jgi:hypothetical protein
MIILRQKTFSMKEEQLKELLYFTPDNIKKLPQPIQKYYQYGINKDLYKLAQLQNTIGLDCVLGPIPCPDEFEEEKNGQIYRSLFGWDIEDIDLDHADIWYDESGNLYKKSGIIFKSFNKIGVNDLKDYLKKQIIEDDEIGETYKDDKNYKQIVSLEKQIISKIDKL